MNRLSEWLSRWRRAVLLSVVAITLLSVSFIPSIRHDDDVIKFLPQHDEDIKLFRRVSDEFGGLEVVLVGVKPFRGGNFFTTENLKRLKRLTDRLKSTRGVKQALSFIDLPHPVSREWGLEVRELVDSIPEPGDKDGLNAVREKVLSDENALGQLVSEDGDAAVVLCFLDASLSKSATVDRLVNSALELWPRDRLFVGGAPAISAYLANTSKRDLLGLIPFVCVVVIGVTLFCFRKILGVIMAIGTVGLGLVWIMGGMAVTGTELTIVANSLPTILMAIGGAYGIHILTAYYQGECDDVPSRVREALNEAGPPVLASSLTTAAGFMSFLLMDLEPMREFGLWAGLGVLSMGAMSLLAIPAVLYTTGHITHGRKESAIAPLFEKIGAVSARHRLLFILIMCITGAAGAVNGGATFRPSGSLRGFFSPDSPPGRADAFLSENFGGSEFVQIYMEGDMRSPHVLTLMRRIVMYARMQPESVQVNSILDAVAPLSGAMGSRRGIPSSTEKLRSLYPFLEGNPAVGQLINKDYSGSVIQIKVRAASAGPDVLVEKMRNYLKEHVPAVIRPVSLKDNGDADRAALKSKVDEVFSQSLSLIAVETDFDMEDLTPSMKNALDSLKKESAGVDFSAGKDVLAAARKAVQDGILGDSSPFELPEEGENEALSRELETGTVALEKALSELMTKQFKTQDVKDELVKALPILTQIDEEGVDMAADMINAQLQAARARVRALRILGKIQAIVNVKIEKKLLEEKITAILSEIDDPETWESKAGPGSMNVSAQVTGEPVINQAFNRSVVRNQVRSIIGAAVVLFLIIGILFRSVGASFKGMAPAAWMLMIAVGTMPLFGVPLDPTTSMIAAIALGIGVDYGIHFMWRRRRRGESLALTTRHTGPAVAYNAIQVAAGFAVLGISRMLIMRRFGLLVALTMILSAVATFILLPALRAEGSRVRKSESCSN